MSQNHALTACPLDGLTDEGICSAYLRVLSEWIAHRRDEDLLRRLRLLEEEIDRRDLWDSPHLPPGRPVLIDEALALALYGKD